MNSDQKTSFGSEIGGLQIKESGLGMAASARWIDKDGTALACKDKLATLEDNLEELLEIALEALEDAAVMGVDLNTARKIFADEISALEPRFAARSEHADGSPNAEGSNTPSSGPES